MSIEIGLTLFAIFLLVALSAFFNGSETALTAASRARMHALEQEGNKRAALVNRLIASDEKLIGPHLVEDGAVVDFLGDIEGHAGGEVRLGHARVDIDRGALRGGAANLVVRQHQKTVRAATTIIMVSQRGSQAAEFAAE